MQERAVPTAQQILAGMGLGQCTKGATVQEANQPATVYTYDYLPDDNGFVAHGKMWISETTGLAGEGRDAGSRTARERDGREGDRRDLRLQ